MIDSIVIATAQDRVAAAVRGALADDPVFWNDPGCAPSEPRFRSIRHRLGQTLRRFSDLLDPVPPIRSPS